MLLIALSAVVLAALVRGTLSLWRVIAAVPHDNADFSCF